MLKRMGILVFAAVVGMLCLEAGEKMSIPGVFGVVSPAHAVIRPRTRLSGGLGPPEVLRGLPGGLAADAQREFIVADHVSRARVTVLP
jgi:hypothetical protein